MANISVLARLINGVQRNVDLSANTLVVDTLKVGGGSGTDLTKTILDRLVSLQNGTDVDATYHTHDGRYYTETELGSATGTTGSDLIGDDNTYSNFTPTAATVKGALAGIDTALATAGGSEFSDAMWRIYDDGDNTKKIAFQASGISTSTTRTITMPDSNVDLGKVATAIQRDGSVTFTANQPMGSFKLTGLAAGSGAGDSVRYEQTILTSGTNAFAGNQSFGGFKATNLGDPTANQDAVTLAYLNARIAGLKPKAAARVASTANVVIATALENGDTLDGVTLATGDRVLLKDQTLPEENGIYIVAASGAASRSSDFDSVSPIDEINGAWLAIQEGTASAGKVYVQFGTVAVVGTDSITFEYWNPIAGLIGGDMITFAGSTFSVDLATASGLESTNPGNAAGQLRIKLEASNPSLKFTGSNELAAKLDAAGAIASGASGLAVQVDGSTIEISSNALRVKDAGITLAKLASNSVDENKIVSTTMSASGAITGGSGTKLAVAVDGTSIEINSNALRVKSTAYDQVTITGGSGTAAAVAQSPSMKRTLVAGQSFSANTSYAVRWGVTANGETANRVYAADTDTSSFDLFYVIGMASSGSAISAGQNITVTSLGSFSLSSSDSAFAASSDGKAVFLTAAGTFSLTAPSSSGLAVTRIGVVQLRSATAASNIIDVAPAVVGVA